MHHHPRLTVLCCVPVSLSDRKLAAGLERSFEIFPPGSGHRLLIVGSPNVYAEVHDLAQRLSRFFAGAAQTFIFETDRHDGWPTACNCYAQETANHIATILAPEDHWLWLELDCTPVKSAWLDEIARGVEFAQTGERPQRPRFFGVKEPTRLESYGRLMSAEEAGENMAAVGVYPGDMTTRVPTLRTVSATNIPWNVFIRWYTTYEFFAPIPQIQNNWRTANYERKADGKIGCESVANWAWDIHFNREIAPETVLVHGCKDASLLELLAAEHEMVKDTGIPVEEYWTDGRPEAVEEEKKAVAARIPRKLNPTKDQVAAARQRLMAMHEKRRAAAVQAATV